jgi:glutamate N-acetyltransferase/amino-acid N-acetyltransferase
LTDGYARAVVVNAGNANACTGSRGRADALRMTELAARAVGAQPGNFAVASTGVIGHPLPMAKVETGIADAARALSAEPTAAAAFARAICTTDRWTKETLRTVTLSGQTVTVAGAAKGAGMISPKLATMLAFVTTDAHVTPELLAPLTREAADGSFNRLTVDGDTSTNDALLVLASGQAHDDAVEAGSDDAARLSEALTEVCLELARSIARDGEGARRLVTVHVTGAADDDQAERAARKICNSPLVKTAMFGADPNWGRIIVAAGSAGVRLDETTTTLRIGGQLVFEAGTPHAPGPELLTHMKGDAVELALDLGQGQGTAVLYTCDLGHDYVTLNAEYHT